MNIHWLNLKKLPPFLVISLLSLVQLPLGAWAKIEEPFNPPKNIALMPGPGFIHHPVTTRYPLAQRFFDQGFTMLYAFNHDAAYSSFKKASEIDPQMAMVYWGMALALGANINIDISSEREKEAYAVIQKALTMIDQVTDNERAYIEALSKRYSNDPNPDYNQLSNAYYLAMKEVVHDFPEDLDAATLFAESILDLHPWDQWTLDGQPKEGTLEVIGVLDSVLKRDPQHLGANHYYIHAIEASQYPERAWKAADRLRHMLPISGHITHMPSHIDMLVGDYHAAVAANEAAVAADRAYIQEYGIGGYYPLHYMSHNLAMLSRAYMMEGRFNGAIRSAEDLEAFYTPHFHLMPDLEFYQTAPLLALLRFHRWNDILKTPPPPADMLVSNAFWHYARAMAYASIGQERLAKDEQKRLQDNMNQLPSTSTYGLNPTEKLLTIANLLINAKLAETQGNIPDSIQLLQQAVELEDNLRYNEPSDWYYPIRESLGAALLKSSRFKEAELIFHETLEKHPRNGRALFGLLESLKAQARPIDAFWVKRELEQAWKYSDTPLSINDL